MVRLCLQFLHIYFKISYNTFLLYTVKLEVTAVLGRKIRLVETPTFKHHFLLRDIKDLTELAIKEKKEKKRKKMQ